MTPSFHKIPKQFPCLPTALSPLAWSEFWSRPLAPSTQFYSGFGNNIPMNKHTIINNVPNVIIAALIYLVHLQYIFPITLSKQYLHFLLVTAAFLSDLADA